MTEDTIRIRVARAAEYEDIDRLWDRCNLTAHYDPYPRDRAFTSGSADLFVAFDHHKGLVGSVMAGYEQGHGALHYLAVDPSCGCAGLGRRLVRHAEDWLGAKGIWPIQLNVQSSNLSVHDFYGRLAHAHTDVVDLSRLIGEPQVSAAS
ncbi:GNAT family N-acetyltransferase [Magnetospira sp. QH-2]|uniref:GNAT family N-acetyltransferase n=1 Tax=Magnetospira sp. (strain QH-2) TaxID=1288970 RepID=UPI0003E81517|nr:GNAT family N-acetyltransferase [Magnetospira sp. QH-2]CCQ74361.1 putative Acetyltransferase ypeA [Magnetospira sp. QH-2]